MVASSYISDNLTVCCILEVVLAECFLHILNLLLASFEMLIVLLAISFKSRSSRVVPLWSKLSINPNELAEREERVSRIGDTTVVAAHHHASEPS